MKRRRIKEEEVEVKEKDQVEETDTEEFEDEEESLSSGIVLSGEKILRLSTDPNDVPDGEYLGEFSRWKYIPPRENRPGGFRVWMRIEDSDNDEPEDGWPEVDHFFRIKYENPTEGQKKAISINMQDFSRFLIACLGDLSGEDKNAEEWLDDALGCQIYFTVAHETYNGNQYKKLRGFRSAE